MEFSIETKISNFIENQFPSFYREEGPTFILFMKAYFEWMESNGNPIYHSRNLLNYGDIDNTIDDFLVHFEKKYLFGVPFETVVNKRFMIKHVLDAYRSKSSIQGHKLLFKLLYNLDSEIYIPGRDILKPSDGTWKEPKYLEVTDNGNLNDLVGKEIEGSESGTLAVVESFVKESFDSDIINTLFISNITPKNQDFTIGEAIVLKGQASNTSAITSAPILKGSLNGLQIINGGQNFKVGNILKIVKRDITNNNIISFGQNGLLRVANVGRGFGSINFDILSGGFGYLSNSATFVYNGTGDTSGTGAGFGIDQLTNQQLITYNTDVICNYSNLQLDATTYGFPGDGTANLTANIGNALTFRTDTFGTITTLANITTGNNYTNATVNFVRSNLLSNGLPGSISYTTSSNTITGTSTIFDSIFAANDVIQIQANSSLNATQELQVIKEVTNSTQIILYGPPQNSSTASAVYRAAPTILPANFATYDSVMVREDETLNGENENIRGLPASGNDIITSVSIVDSGKSYLNGEDVDLYLQGGLSNVVISSGGSGYQNNELVIFSGGGTPDTANAVVGTDSNGVVTSVVYNDRGSGYQTTPTLTVRTSNGTGASLSVNITEFNIASLVEGKVTKGGVGVGRGFWSTTRSHLSSDKFIQDSYFYQDFSYQIKVQKILAKYKDIIKDTFHSAGSELFGEFELIQDVSSNIELLHSSNTAVKSFDYTSDSNILLADNNVVTVDSYTFFATADRTYTVDRMLPLADFVS
jgi:hypothetical protein